MRNTSNSVKLRSLSFVIFVLFSPFFSFSPSQAIDRATVALTTPVFPYNPWVGPLIFCRCPFSAVSLSAHGTYKHCNCVRRSALCPGVRAPALAGFSLPSALNLLFMCSFYLLMPSIPSIKLTSGKPMAVSCSWRRLHFSTHACLFLSIMPILLVIEMIKFNYILVNWRMMF